MRVVRRSVQGDHPSPGRGQAIAPTMDEPRTPLRGHRGASFEIHHCNAAARLLLRSQQW
jgi:hypothetical protein